MSLYEGNDIKGWLSMSFSGLGFGFIIGLFIIARVDEDAGLYYLIGSSVLGLIIGIFIAYFINRKTPMRNWFEPLYRSPELDDHQDRFCDQEKDADLLD